MNRKRTYPNLKTWRDENNLTQRQAAARLGVSQSVYSRWETQTRAPKPKLAKTVSAQAGVPLESVLGIA
jgi:transcriptional regulator with XRE-family HTH domain